jgi:hypothetical protein
MGVSDDSGPLLHPALSHRALRDGPHGRLVRSN